MGPHEPYWRTNSSFSPPPPRWDFQFQSEGHSFGSQDGIQLYASSTSSNSRESRNWMRGNHLPSLQYLVSDVVEPYFNSPSNLSPAQRWTPSMEEINVDDCGTSERVAVLGSLPFSPIMEGTSTAQDSRSSTSSLSESSDHEPQPKSHSHRNISSHRCFISKPIHPVPFQSELSMRQASDPQQNGFSEFEATTPLRDKHCLSSASCSVEFVDVSEDFESNSLSTTYNPLYSFRCGLCGRFLSQRSPWSSRRIVLSGDMPVAGVLSCCHVFHAECLEQTTPKTHKNDPPCPLCVRSEEGSSQVRQNLSKLKTGFPRLKSCSEDGQSRPWSCGQAGDCVEAALHVPPRNTMFLLNRNRIKKNLSNIRKDYPGKSKKNGLCSSQMLTGSVDHGGVGSSKTPAGSAMKW